MIRTYKYRLKGKRATRQLRRYAFAVNTVWNYCVQTQKAIQRRHRDGLTVRWPSHFALCKMTRGTSVDLGVHAQTIQGVCGQFAKSRDQHGKCPRFRASGGPRRSLGWVPFSGQKERTTGDSITYLGNTYRWFGAARRSLPPVVKGGAFVEDSRGRWYVTLHVEVGALAQAPDVAVGIDLGLKTLATLSTGEKIANPRLTAEYAERLATAQRAGNRARARAINARIKNARLDGLHKASHAIASTHRTIIVGDVSSSQLARTRMSKSVHDAGWSIFRAILRYKASRHGGEFLEVGEKFTSQTCSSCGALPTTRPIGIAGLGIRTWVCSECGVSHDRDVNAARNILALGLSSQPRGDESRVLK